MDELDEDFEPTPIQRMMAGNAIQILELLSEDLDEALLGVDRGHALVALAIVFRALYAD